MTRSIPDSAIPQAIVDGVAACAPGKTICPSDVAKTLLPHPEWQKLMTPLRREAMKLARDGRIGIYRKGRIVNPHEDIKGVIRLGSATPPQSE